MNEDQDEAAQWSAISPQSPISSPNPWVEEILARVYLPTFRRSGILQSSTSPLSINEVHTHLERLLTTRSQDQDELRGRLGPKNVAFDINSNKGSLVISQDRLGVTSQSNFNTVKANCCVFEGRWQYEVSLGSKGLMQIGWATAMCEFNDEKGVGDTANSFAFDGNRIRKWNVSTTKYGVPWMAGDVIGCCIDLGEGTVTFYRNGVCLGEAFRNVKRGPGFAYFPAVSLSFGENLVANFGTSRFRYPVEGYRPLVRVPDTSKAKYVCEFLQEILQVYEKADDIVVRRMSDDGNQILHRGSLSLALLVAAPLIEYFPLVVESLYVLEVTLVPLLESAMSENDDKKVVNLLTILWTLLDWKQTHNVLEKLSIVLISSYSFACSSLGYPHQKLVLKLFVIFLSHIYTRRFLMCKVLFEKGRFSALMKVKPLDIQHLEKIVPDVWFEVLEDAPQSPDEACKKTSYMQSRENIKNIVSEVENLQIELLRKATQDDDNYPPLGQTSRDKFLCEFEKLLEEHSLAHSATTLQSSLSTVAISYLHRLISVIRQGLPIVNLNDGSDLRENDFYVPLFHFVRPQWITSVNTRIGGPFNALRTAFSAEMKAILFQTSPQVDRAQANATIKALKLVDCVVFLYSAVVHEQLMKAALLRDSMKEYLKAYRSILASISKSEANSWERVKLECSRDVVKEKLDEQSRQLAWLGATMFSKEKQLDLYWLLQVLLHTLEEASRAGACFAFVPDFYVETCLKLFEALTVFFPPTSALQEIPGHFQLNVRFSTFLAMHFSDKRVTNTDVKEVLMQALANQVCPPNTLRALECMSIESSQTMISALLQPYNRVWAQANWILVRLWKGCGFAFRYSKPPHLVEKKMTLLKPRVSPVIPHQPKPCPSVFFQNLISKYLDEHPVEACVFVESVLSQLTWSFSEFISMLQEIQTAHHRPERVLVDSRQLKVCSTCFNLTVSLLRVIEMIANLSPNCLIKSQDPGTPSYLPKIIQIISHIINRFSYGKGCFDFVMSLDMVGLETVDQFPIITAATGVLIAFLLKGPKENRDLVLQHLARESSFVPKSVERFLSVGARSAESASSKEATEPFRNNFCLTSYSDIKEEEIDQVRQLIQVINKIEEKERGPPDGESSVGASIEKDLDSDDTCTICYASPKQAVFEPCRHGSCRECIQQHLANNETCFFCKATIIEVECEPPIALPKRI